MILCPAELSHYKLHRKLHDAVLDGLGGGNGSGEAEPVTYAEHYIEKIHKAAGPPA